METEIDAEMSAYESQIGTIQRLEAGESVDISDAVNAYLDVRDFHRLCTKSKRAEDSADRTLQMLSNMMTGNVERVKMTKKGGIIRAE